jgi:hypothetical protein
MRHPDQAILALHAGGDLGLWARWRTERHVARCEQCRAEIAAFDELRQTLPSLAETPELPWNRLAAEMRANIRLGLAAGECVRGLEPDRPTRVFSGFRAAVALASVMVLVVTGIVIERPAPNSAPIAARDTGIVVQTTQDGIQVREGGQSLGLLNPTAMQNDITYQVGAEGSMEARYVDSNTGHVVVNQVDVD